MFSLICVPKTGLATMAAFTVRGVRSAERGVYRPRHFPQYPGYHYAAFSDGPFGIELDAYGASSRDNREAFVTAEP